MTTRTYRMVAVRRHELAALILGQPEQFTCAHLAATIGRRGMHLSLHTDAWRFSEYKRNFDELDRQWDRVQHHMCGMWRAYLGLPPTRRKKDPAFSLEFLYTEAERYVSDCNSIPPRAAWRADFARWLFAQDDEVVFRARLIDVPDYDRRLRCVVSAKL